MASGLQRVRLTAPDQGIDVDDSPNAIPSEKGIVLQNYLTGEKGRVRQRGPLVIAAQSVSVSNARVIGGIPGRDRVLLTYKDALTDTNKIEPWVAPRADAPDVNPNTNLAKLKAANPGAKSLNLTGTAAATSIDTTGTRSQWPSWAWTRMGNFVYCIGYDSDNDTGAGAVGFSVGVNDRGGAQRLTRLMRFDIRNPTTVPQIYTYGPYGMQDVRLHYNRLFILGGRHPNTIGPYIENNCIWYTRRLSANHHNYGFSPNDHFAASVPQDDDNSLADGVGAVEANAGDVRGNGWASDRSGATVDNTRSPAYGERAAPGVYNQIFLPWEEDFGVAFGSVGRNLGIFKRHYLLILQGFGVTDTSGVTDFELRTALTGVGALDPRSIVEANEGVYFLSSHGFTFFDGVRAHDASAGMKRTLLAAGLEAVGDDGDYSMNGGFAVAKLLDRDYIMLTIGYAPFSSGTVPVPTVTFCGIYHIPSNSWSTFTSSTMVATGGGPTWLARTENSFAIMDHVDARRATRITTPEQATEPQRGKDDGAVIATKWHSKVVELAAPFERAHFHRVIVDYEWIKDGSAATPDADPGTGPTVTLCDGSGNALGGQATFTIPYGQDSGNEVLRQRHVHDVFGEASEVMVKIEYTGTATALVACSIQDVWVEYEVSHERHTFT